MASEWVKCAQDPEYFAENYVYIKHVDQEKRVLFKMRWYQKKIIKACTNNRQVIVKLPRQAGKTVTISLMLLWHLLFLPNFSILIVAHKGEKAREILASIKEMYEDLPVWLQQGILEWNKGNIILETRSRIRAIATSGSSARGDVYNVVYIDEMAFIATHVAESFLKSVIPTVSSGETTKIFITSTPQGFNAFHKQWDNALKKKSAYVPIEIKWNDIPGRDETFRKNVIAEYGQPYFDQEYGAEFLGSSLTLVSGSKLGVMTYRVPLKESEHYRIFAEAQKGRQYLATVDTAEGVGRDYSTICVFDVSVLPYEVAAVYQNHYISPKAYPVVIRGLCKAYNECPVLVESNFGAEVADGLHYDLEYEGTLMTVTSSKKGQTISAGFAQNARMGLKMDKMVKRLGCSNLKTLIENDQLITNDYQILFELQRFVKDKDSWAAEEGNDDLVMCLVMFAWLQDQGYVRDLTDVKTRDKIRNLYQTQIDDESAPLGFSDHGEPPIEEQVPIAVRRDRNWLFPELREELVRAEKELGGINSPDGSYLGTDDRRIEAAWSSTT